jgi:nitrite reductase/ring-hydroxylating ferredoxin subunit
VRLAEEQLIRHSPIPYSIVRTTPFFESLDAIADMATDGSSVRLPPVLVQPVAAGDVVRLIAAIAVAAPLNGAVEIGGPEPFYLDGLVQRVLGTKNDGRAVIADAHARYAGARLDERSLMAGDEAELGEIRFDDWLRRTAPGQPGANAAVPVETSHERREFRVGDVSPGSVLLVGDVAVFSVAGGLCATQAMCTHRAGPLSEGTIDDNTVTCPLHGAQFNVWTGAVLRGPATAPLKTYRVIVEGDVGRVVADEPRVMAAR